MNTINRMGMKLLLLMLILLFVTGLPAGGPRGRGKNRRGADHG
jgi:hypothetical protein